MNPKICKKMWFISKSKRRTNLTSKEYKNCYFKPTLLPATYNLFLVNYFLFYSTYFIHFEMVV